MLISLGLFSMMVGIDPNIWMIAFAMVIDGLALLNVAVKKGS